jgi:hypothetical protein
MLATLVPLRNTVPTVGQSVTATDYFRVLIGIGRFAVKIKFVRRNTSRKYYALQHHGPVKVSFRSRRLPEPLRWE